MSILAGALGYSVRQKASLAMRLEERDKMRLIAESGARKSIVALNKEEIKSYDCLLDDWSNNPSVFRNIDAGSGTCTVSYDYLNENTGQIQTFYGLVDEARKININKADQVVIERLFRSGLGLGETESQDLAASIVDWRDGDSELSVPTGSAESSYYRNIQNPYESKDGPLEVLDELLLIKGMTNELLTKMKGYITIYGDGKININTASKIVFIALGVKEKMADDIISFRCGKDKIAGTADDGVFDAPSRIVPLLSQYANMSDSQVAEFSLVSGNNFVTISEIFTVNSHCRLNGSNDRFDADCVIDKKGKILYWRDGEKLCSDQG